jgi:PadR family transcriptional regulator PadR
MSDAKAELLRGTLDLLILKAVAWGPSHGYGIARWLETVSEDLLQIEEGSLYPALYRLEGRGWIESEWGRTDTNRRAKYYTLTRRGRDQLAAERAGWDRLVRAVTLVLEARPAGA